MMIEAEITLQRDMDLTEVAKNFVEDSMPDELVTEDGVYSVDLSAIDIPKMWSDETGTQKITFKVQYEVQHVEGKFVSKDDLRDLLHEEILGASSFDDEEYWEVDECL